MRLFNCRSNKVALSANPILAIVSAISLVTTLLPVAINLFDSLFVSAKKATEQMEESVSEFEEATEHVKDLNKELETTQDRIDELNAKDNLTFVEESELQK